MKPEEVAVALGLGRTKVYQLIAGGHFPTVRVGTVIRIPVDAVRQWIEDRTGAGRAGEGETDGGRR